MTTRIAARLDSADPGLIRVRRGARTVCAAVLSGVTIAIVAAWAGVADSARIALFGAGVCFFGALLVADARRQDRVRTFGMAPLVSCAAIAVSVELSRLSFWAATAFLVVQMFLSYALRRWSARAATLAVIGAVLTFLTTAMHITGDRIGWFALAAAVGFVWITIAEYTIVPDDPTLSMRRAVDAMCRCLGAAVVDAAECLSIGHIARHPQRALDRVVTCRRAIESIAPTEPLRVALYCAERGCQALIGEIHQPHWAQALPDDLAAAIRANLRTFDAADPKTFTTVANEAHCLCGRIHDTPHLSPEEAHAALTVVGGAQLIAESASQATRLAAQARPDDRPSRHEPTVRDGLDPNVALAIQVGVAATVGCLIAAALRIDQSLLVVWTAYVVIAGSAEASARRAWLWLAATVTGSTAGVAIAASIPDRVGWTVLAVLIGVFGAMVTAPVSYPAMVFWLNIVLVPLVATEGQYLDIIVDKTVAAAVGGVVAIVVALVLVPIRLRRSVRESVLVYLDALSEAVESQVPGTTDRRASTGTVLDRAHRALNTEIASATADTQLFPRPVSPSAEEGLRVAALHQAYLNLTPLLTAASRRLHGWTDERIESDLRGLREAVDNTKADLARADPSSPIDDLRRRCDEFALRLRAQGRSD